MKDYFDLWHLARNFAFDGRCISESIQTTFKRRNTPLPSAAPVGMTEEFWNDAKRQALWLAFCKKSVRIKPVPMLEEVVKFVEPFIVPPALAASRGEVFAQEWQPGGPWTPKS
jgi:hypothetical protein